MNVQKSKQKHKNSINADTAIMPLLYLVCDLICRQAIERENARLLIDTDRDGYFFFVLVCKGEIRAID
jgi:hypothetical protein